jgi:hypothetical protein
LPKQTTNKATKRQQHQNRKKYEIIVEEIRLYNNYSETRILIGQI